MAQPALQRCDTGPLLINIFKLSNCFSKSEELSRVLSQMKVILQGTQGMRGCTTETGHHTRLTRRIETDSSPEQIYQLVTGMIDEDLLHLLAINLYRLPFESRKDTQVIFSYIFRFRPAAAAPKSDPIALSYVVCNRPQVLVELCRGYDHKESATPAGSVLRELLKNEAAAAVILYDDGDAPGSSAKGLNAIDRDRPQSGRGVFWRFYDWIDKSSFEVAADAFTTFRVSAASVPRFRANFVHSI
jgi:calcium binding protein 39